MNTVILMGRTTRNADIGRTNAGGVVARFTLAVDRIAKAGEPKQADFIGITAFGKTAEFIDKYVGKGQKIAVQGRINTGSYDKDGRTIYTFGVIADRVEVCEWQHQRDEAERDLSLAEQQALGFDAVTDGDDDLPF